MLQDFLSLHNVGIKEIDQRAEFLKKLVEYNNIHLDNLNISQVTQRPMITLSEKCNLRGFSSHAPRGVNIHKGQKHKDQM